MTLAARLIVLVAGALFFSLLAGGILIMGAASHWVQTEIYTAANVARELVDQRLAEAAEEAESPERLTELLRSLETGYHIRAVYRPDDRGAAGTAPATSHRSVLSRVLGVHPIVQEIPVSLPDLPTGRIELAIDPEPEVERVQRAIELSFLAIALFSTTTLILVAIGLTRSLRPLGQLAGALSRVGTGDYSLRIAPGGPHEISLLGLQFNRMADQLQRVQARARALDAQMLAVQERERREIAKDLHDELGPCLLAANLDVSALIRLNRSGSQQAIEDCASGLASLLARMQELVRGIIDRLHLTPADGIDFPAGVQELVAFWQDRCPEIEWRVACRGWDPGCPEAVAASLLRVVQEALANAVRHSGARRVTVSSVEDGGDLVLRIVDDGIGMAEGGREGMGLAGMRDRVESLGGTLRIESEPGHGTTVTATLPSTALSHNALSHNAGPHNAGAAISMAAPI